jgi:hypothetical protein
LVGEGSPRFNDATTASVKIRSMNQSSRSAGAGEAAERRPTGPPDDRSIHRQDGVLGVVGVEISVARQ